LQLRHTAKAVVWGEKLSLPGRDALVARYLYPLPRLAMREALRLHARAAMDISDGLAGDLAKMLRLAGMTTDVDFADIPLSPAAREALWIDPDLAALIVSGGDDYEILAAVPPEKAKSFEQKAVAEGIAVARIGTVVTGEGGPHFSDSSGRPMLLSAPSYQHF
jgi:thiamine-monophosphate kinase